MNELQEAHERIRELERKVEALQAERYHMEYRRANEDPTGQDLDDFLEATKEEDSYDYVECDIQRAELRFGC